MSIITLLTDPSKGGTFLSWSLHFLAGHDEYYYATGNRWLSLPHNPVGSKNAHGFAPNQPTSYDRFCVVSDRLLNQPAKNFHTLYFHHFVERPWSKEFADTKKAIEKSMSISHKLIVLFNNPKNLLYEKSFRSRASAPSLIDANKILYTDSELFDDYVQYFFADSLEKWNALDLTEIWDRREFLALNYRHQTMSIAPLIDLSTKHFGIDCLQWFNTGDTMIFDLFDFLEIKIDQNRLAMWIPVYQHWRKLHYQSLNFLWYFDTIVNYIVSGHDMDLSRFDLDIYQEAIIQHELIYTHNLNLKTFQLEKFTNTLQLHKLLEPNTHQLTNL